MEKRERRESRERRSEEVNACTNMVKVQAVTDMENGIFS
jgi:hypothetical protein